MTNAGHGDASVLKVMFAYNTWANLRLLEYCERLSAEQLDATAVGGFGSIRDTLQHIINAEISYVERVNGRLPEAGALRDAFPAFAVLKDAVRWAGDELLGLAISAREDTLVLQRPPRPRYQYRLASLMVQSVSHSTEHRAQIAAIITQLGVEPPDTSTWQYMEDIGEFEDLEAALQGG
jgi:uncharacterized damage-inducible protein DinB